MSELRSWTRDYLAQIQLVARVGLELRITRFQVQHPNHSPMLPPLATGEGTAEKICRVPDKNWTHDFPNTGWMCARTWHYGLWVQFLPELWKSFVITSLFIFVEPQYASGAALSSSSRRLLIKTHGTSLRLYHLWLPLPIPLAMLRNYAKDQNALSGSTTMPQDQDNTQKPDKLLSSIVNRILIFFELKSKGDDQDNEWRIPMNNVIQWEKKKWTYSCTFIHGKVNDSNDNRFL